MLQVPPSQCQSFEQKACARLGVREWDVERNVDAWAPRFGVMNIAHYSTFRS